MKKNNFLFSLSMSLFLCLLLSCSDDESISNKQLLPSQIKLNYNLSSSSPGTSVEVVDAFTYDDDNRLTNISHTYTSTSESKSVNLKNTVIKYDTDGRIIEANITSSENSAISKVSVEKYSYDGDKIKINKDGKDFATIQLSSKNITLTYALVGESKEVVTYELDDRGNVIEYVFKSDYTNKYRYTTDRKNGIFKDVNTPHWFLITQTAFSEYQLENTIKRYTSGSSDDKWIEYTYNEIQYNKDLYPVSIRTKPSPDWLGISSSTMTIEYIPAKTIIK
ncbi:hypothetical protein G7050_05440 [Dysgonomonas sp. HDW5A]|uniref:hypothetical protein n=1 Tax=Dysgonomonas sp. HDW5A TaxID=2714926 RepID=UPI00140A76F9|nr:hypothetical protein [Dysgonomonas sp. HDW5A]QIK59309.1 hypothetical protein G7050_05440 [Dysgonomonas sp. HDW5A]